MRETEITLRVNGEDRTVRTAAGQTLLEVLRDDLGLTGTKEGCGQGDCGACVVLIDGKAVNACLVLAPQAHGTDVLTVEGLARDGRLHPLQQQFAAKWAFQCGYCTPGMLMSCYALLLDNPDPQPDDVRIAIAGNLCRCTGYAPIVEAVLAVAKELRPAEPGHEANHG